MGAHTLGGVRDNGQGYSGVWTPGEINNFDNSFYKHLIDGTIMWKNMVSIELRLMSRLFLLNDCLNK